ncbi:MAG: hypothetical protein OEL54_02120 [Flavobacteriaceae bacterium]|nr:hypothetical protein [Flavobacteriaceae bacterium]
MKTLIKLIVLSILISCGGSGSDDPTVNPQPTNKAPNKTTNIAPTNNLLCISNNVIFEWSTAIDDDGDAVNYQLLIAKDNQFTQGVQTISNLITTSTQVTLEKGVAYYWKVKAIDVKNASSEFSTTFQFYTESAGTINYAPFVPQLVTPVLHSTVQGTSVSLEWNATDVDNDPLIYDVLFGTENPPINKVSENQSGNKKTVNLSANKEYYWKIVAKDGKGGETFGQIWRFITN